jgi:hypothetical protein
MKNNTKNVRKGITAILFAVVMIASVFAVVPAMADIIPGGFFVYANFASGDQGYVSGQSVGGYGDMLYVTSGGYCYVYKVSIPAGADPDDHPLFNGQPMAARTLTFQQKYNFVADGVPSYQSTNEWYVDATGIYYGVNSGIHKWNRNSDGTFGSYVGKVVTPGLSGAQTLAYDSLNDVWYAGHWNRNIYSISTGGASWTYEFTYPTYAGSHHDGMEFVAGHLFISDMTSNWIGQWKKNPDGSWTEVDRFGYTSPVDDDVEGMGFGPLGHLWATGWSRLYELGGGPLVVALSGIPDQCIFVGESFNTFDLDDYVSGAGPFMWTYSGTVNLGVSIDGENVVTVTYPAGWTGSETITFTATGPMGSASDDATFTVCPVPVVGDILNQTAPFTPFDLDDNLSGIDSGDVTWSASEPCDGWTVDIDADNVVNVSAPDGATEPCTITFTATTSCCGREASDSDDATFIPNQPPDVADAHPSIDCLWPPNHKFVDITILGVTDPDGDLVSITITGITSDEPTASIKGAGGDKHAPDADGVGTDTASLRAERSGTGNGRVYEITFVASDGKGGETEGSVTVCVPHDYRGKCTCGNIDDGQIYDATQINV